MDLKRKIAKNTVIQIIGKSLSTIFGIATLAVMARYLGTGEFGKYSTIISFTTFFAMSADLGLTLISAQIISDPKENQDKALSNLFSLRLISALILLGLAPIIAIFLPYTQEIKTGVLISTLIFLFPALNQILTALFQKNLKMEKVMIAEVFSKLSLLFFIILFIELDLGLFSILWASALGAFIGFLILWLFGKKSAKIKLEFDPIYFKKIIKRTWPLALTIILNLVYQKGDILILSLFSSNEEVGIYGASHRAIEVIGTIPYMFAGIMLPLFTINWINKEKEFLNKIIQKSFDFMIILAIPLAVGVQFVAERIMILIAGEDFVGSGLALQILIISIAMLFVSCIFSHIIIAINKQKRVIGLYFFTAILSFILFIFLIPKYSYQGAALVTIVSNFIILLGTIYFVKKFTSFSPKFKILKKTILSSILMALFMYLLPKSFYNNNFYLLIIIIIAMSIYFLSLYLLKGISKDDIKTFLPKKLN